MRFRHRYLIIAALLLAPAVPASGQPVKVSAPDVQMEPARLALAQQIITLAFPENARAEMFDRLLLAITKQMRSAQSQDPLLGSDPGIQAIVDRHLDSMLGEIRNDLGSNMSGLFDAMAHAYAREFSTGELAEIRSFIATPAGTRYVQRSPQLMSDPDVAAWNTAYMSRVLAKTRASQETLKKELLEYLATHKTK